MRTIGKIIILSMLLFLLFGCTNSLSEKPKTQSQSSSIENIQVKPKLAQDVNKIAESVKGVDDSTAVVIDQDISVAVKVSGFQRFRLDSIKQEVYKNIKKVNKAYKVHVTSDKKLFMQLQQIEKNINNQKPVVDIEKKIDKINKDMLK